MEQTPAVVLLSGGQDSTTCLYWALTLYGRVEAVSFDYGQRHSIELELARKTAADLNLSHVMLPVEALTLLAGGTLTNPAIPNTEGGAPAPSGWHHDRGLPPSFVPGRNLLFFTLAAAWAIPRGITEIVTGVCATDRAGYPDCRREFVTHMRDAIAVGMDEPRFEIIAPLLDRTKAQTWQLADDLGVLDRIVEDTATCYEGDREHLHTWGYGCGNCGACVERRSGFMEFDLARAGTAAF